MLAQFPEFRLHAAVASPASRGLGRDSGELAGAGLNEVPVMPNWKGHFAGRRSPWISPRPARPARTWNGLRPQACPFSWAAPGWRTPWRRSWTAPPSASRCWWPPTRVSPPPSCRNWSSRRRRGSGQDPYPDPGHPPSRQGRCPFRDGPGAGQAASAARGGAGGAIQYASVREGDAVGQHRVEFQRSRGTPEAHP